MGLAGVEDLLKASMGLSAMSIGSTAVARAVQQRQSVCHLGDLPAYEEHLRLSQTELQALIEAVVVPETWFFRDRHAFSSLCRLMNEEWLPAHTDRVLSVLSLPCSTGEEPYSIAMALLDANIPAVRFRIDAVDISGHNIAQGVRGVYGRNSFRGAELGFRDRHFDATTDGYRVRETVRQRVHFQQGNLFAADFLPGEGIYDVIFCRNVLIYFDRPTQDRALGVLNRLLNAGGVLYVAPAETALPASHRMISTNEPMAFAFRKAGLVPPAAKRTAAHPITLLVPVRGVRPADPVRQAASRVSVRRAVPGPSPPAASSVDPTEDDLDQATRFADEGHFVEAANCCEGHLRRSGPSVRAFHLMGLVREATGNHEEAQAYYRKALYLDPNHYETQIQLALLMEKQGDTAGAQVLQNRARRLELKRKASHD
jgi:chemotaxis protein methyltransferase WspC